MSFAVLDPACKIEYIEGQEVEIALAGDVHNILRGQIVGVSVRGIFDYWIVKLDEKLPDWQFSCIVANHCELRPKGDNRPFLCEGVPR